MTAPLEVELESLLALLAGLSGGEAILPIRTQKSDISNMSPFTRVTETDGGLVRLALLTLVQTWNFSGSESCPQYNYLCVEGRVDE